MDLAEKHNTIGSQNLLIEWATRMSGMNKNALDSRNLREVLLYLATSALSNSSYRTSPFEPTRWMSDRLVSPKIQQLSRCFEDPEMSQKSAQVLVLLVSLTKNLLEPTTNCYELDLQLSSNCNTRNKTTKSVQARAIYAMRAALTSEHHVYSLF